MKKYIHDMLVVGNLQINHNYFILELKSTREIARNITGTVCANGGQRK